MVMLHGGLMRHIVVGPMCESAFFLSLLIYPLIYLFIYYLLNVLLYLHLF